MEERYHATTQNRFYPDMSNVNKNITVEAKLIIPPTYMCVRVYVWMYVHTHIYIQGVTGGTDQTSGGCSLC